MYADAAYAVALGVLLVVHSIALDWIGVMMCLWAQRHGCEVELELRNTKHRLRFRSRPQRAKGKTRHAKRARHRGRKRHD
jgi:hypothetical protein